MRDSRGGSSRHIGKSVHQLRGVGGWPRQFSNCCGSAGTTTVWPSSTTARPGPGGNTWPTAADQAAALIGIADEARPLHVGVLLGNTPDMLTAMAAAGLGGYVLCGINNTRRGDALARDIRRADCQILVTDDRPPGASRRPGSAWRAGPGGRKPRMEGAVGAGGRAHAAPRSRCDRHVHADLHLRHQRRSEGCPGACTRWCCWPARALAGRYGLTPVDVCYLSMPLFHSNAVLAGWSVALNSGAAMAPAAFTASGFIDDIRRYGVTYMNYVGKPLAYILASPEAPDDHDNPLRVAFGNEASDRDIAEFGRRFGCQVWDGFGSTENAVTVTREDGCPAGSIGKGFPGVAIYDAEDADRVRGRAVRRTRRAGQRRRGDRRTGQHPGRRDVRRLLQRPGCHRRTHAPRHLLVRRPGLSGRRRLDLPRRSHCGLDAGRRREHDVGTDRAHPDPEPAISQVAVYPVPDEHVGDQVMAAIVLQDGATLTPAAFGEFLAGQPDLSPKAWPRHVWIADDLPSTATNKVLKRELIAMGVQPAGRMLWKRDGTHLPRRYRSQE